jgi:quinol monooxygenase YgiN
MSIQVLVEFKVKPDKLDEIQPLFSQLLPQTRSSDGNQGVSVFSDLDEPTSVVLMEQWVSREHCQEYKQSRLTQLSVESG